MAVSVALLGWDEEPIRVVQDVDWVLDDRADSTNQLRVTTPLAEADGVDAEQHVIFKGRRFIISSVERDRAADEAVITADEAQAALADVVIVGFRPNSWTLTAAMNAILADTPWTLGEVNGVRYGRADFDEITALDALHFLARHQDAHLSFDSLRRRVNITQNHGTAHEYVFTYGRQLSNIEKDVQQPVTTIIYPTMAEDVALDPVEDYGYYLSQGLTRNEAHARFRKEEHWADSRYEIAENMTRDAQKRLEEEAWPRVTYTLTAQATLDVDGVDDFDLSELHLGDTVYVWDQEIDTKLSAEVTAVTTSSDQSQNELTLSTLPASLGDTVEGRGYFGDSGRPNSGGPRRSGPQPRPSMPILEQMGDYGIAVTRWNGQDHDGNYETIPQRFGTLLTLVAPLEDGVIPSPMDSSHTFMGSDITKRGGGTSTIGFNGYGEFAIWHQMRGWDGLTVSELSEPLVVDVPPVFDPEPLKDTLEELNTRVGEPLDQSISDAVQQARDSLADFQQEWDANWDPDAISGLVERQNDLESDLSTGLQQVHNQAEALAEAARDDAVNQAAANAQSEYDRLQDIAERALSRAGDNILEDPSFETDYWPDEWDGINGFEVHRDTTSPRTGDYQLRVLGEGEAEFPFPSVDVELGMSFRFGIYWATLGYTGSEARLVFKDTDTGEELAVSEPMLTSGYWSRLHVMLEVPEGTESITPVLRVDHVQSATLILEDASLREVGAAAEALRAAEQARHEAQQAHEAAGDAADAAATAYDAASSKSTVHWSLSAPSGTADNSDDVWWQYEVRNGRRVVIGQWFWDDGVWRETEIAEEWLPQVNIGTGTYGDLHGDRLTANTVKAGALAVMPDTEDYAPDPSEFPELWDLQGAILGNQFSATNPSGVMFRLNQDSGQTQIRGPIRPVTPGRQIRFRGRYGWISGSADTPPEVRMEWFTHKDSARTGFTRIISIQPGTPAGWIEGTVTAPDDVAYGRLYIWQIADPGGGETTFWGTMQCEPMVQGVLIEPEGIKSPQVDTAELTASSAFLDNAMVNLIQGRMANFDEALIGGTLLRNNTVATRHLTVTNTEDLFPQEWMDDIHDSVYVFSPAGSSLAVNSFNTRFYQEDPTGVDGNVEWTTTTLQGDRGFQVWPEQNPTVNQRIAFRLGPGKGVMVRPGEQYTFRCRVRDRNDGNFFDVRMALADMETGEGVSQSGAPGTSIRGLVHGADDEFVWTFTIPDNYPRMWMVPSFHSGANSDSGARSILRPQLFRAVDGKLIVDGLLQATTGELQELFFDEAVGNAIAAGSAEFLELDADQIRSNSWTGITATGATFQTHAQADRGVKMQPGGLRGWDSSGNLRFDLSASTGNMLATGIFRTAVGGNRAQLDSDTFGGRLSFFRGSSIGTLKLNDGLDRLEMVYGEGSDPNQPRPNVGVSETQAIMGYRSTQILVGGTSTSNEGISVNGLFRGSVAFRDTIDMQWGARTRYYDNSNRLTATLGQSPSESGSQFQIWMNRGALHIRNDGVFIPRIYETTSSTSANVFVSSSGWLSRATSASRYKLDQQELTVPDSILDVPMIDWVDKAQTELKAEMDAKPRPFTESDQAQYDTINLRRVPGVVAETVESYGGEQFVNYGPDGEIEDVMYDRVALAQIQVLKRKHDALEQRVRELEGAA